jgi:hypothetical protein
MRSVLVVANQTLASPALSAAIQQRLIEEPTRIHVVVPVTPVERGLTWDETRARSAAAERLTTILMTLRALGAEVSGEVGSNDPVAAVQDAMRSRIVDEIIVSTLPPGVSRWLRLDVPSRLSGWFDVPVSVVTVPRQAEVVAGGA